MAAPREDRMLSLFVVVVLGVSSIVANSPSSSDASPKGLHDYCKNDEFRPRCHAQDEVVLVTAARYGLIETSSRCGSSTTPCFEDVVTHLSGQCSGRKSCGMRTSNMTRLVGNCQSSNDFYLNAAYDCVKAEYAGCSKCDQDGYARVKSSDRGRIASFVTSEQDETGCGTARCPWLIEVKPGQVINVTLVDFASVQRSSSSSSSSGSRLSPSWGGEAQCSQADRYALVKERANPKEVVVCGGGSSGGGGTRRHVYTSISNRVEIHVTARDLQLVERPFFVEFLAVGCADVIAPRNTWMRRADDRVEVGCPTTGAKWTMNCVDGQWIGDQMTGAKCPGVPGVVIPGPGPLNPEPPKLGPSVPEDSNKSFITSIPDTILIAAVVAVACIIGVLVLTTGIVCIKKHQYTKRHKPARPSSIYTRATEEFEFRGEVNGQPAGTNPAETTPMMMMMTSMPPQGGAASASRPGQQRGGQPPQTSAKPRVPPQQGLVASGRRYPQDVGNGAQFVEMFDPEQRQMMMIGSRPLPSIPPSGSGDRRPGMALQQAMQQFQPQQQFQTTAMMHHPYQYPSTGIPHGGCYPQQHAECTCHGPPRGQRFVGGPGYQTQPPPLAPKVRTVGTGPTNADGWGGYGASVGGSLNRPYSEAIYGNEGGDLPIYRSGDDQHHYFVLDPDVVRDRPPPSPTPSQRMAAAAAAAATSSSNPPSMTRGGAVPVPGGTGISNSEQRFPTPPPPLPEAVGTPVSSPISGGPQSATADATVSARRQSPDGKERDESRDGGGGTMDELKNANRCSVHEIPLRPARDGPTSGLMSPNGPMKGGLDENESMMGSNISSWP